MTEPLDLDRRLERFLEQPFWRHTAALALIALAAAVRWHHCVLASAALIDEATYLEAFRAAADGRSPYEVGSFHYTPFFAWIGARALSLVGDGGVLALLRTASLLGLAAAAWISTAWLALAWPWRLAIAAGFVLLAPAAGAGLCTGNVSFAVIGVILVALVSWSRGGLLSGAAPSGLALGATVAAKPLAPMALVTLVMHRSGLADEPERRRRIAGITAGLLGGLTAAALLAPAAVKLVEMSAQPIHRLSYARSFSLQRLLSLAGLEVGAVTIVAAGALGLAVLLRFVELDRSRLLAVAVTASVLVTPIVWNHTLVLTLPIQAMALAVAAERRRGAPEALRRRRLYELVFVVLGALAIQLSEGVGAVDVLSRPAQIAFLAVPLLAPALLSAYLVVSGGSAGPAISGGGRRKR